MGKTKFEVMKNEEKQQTNPISDKKILWDHDHLFRFISWNHGILQCDI